MADPRAGDIHKLLDDRNVPEDRKKELVRALYSVDPGDRDLHHYADDHHVELPGGLNFLEGAAVVLTAGAALPLVAGEKAVGKAAFHMSTGDVDKAIGKAREAQEVASTQAALNEPGARGRSDDYLDAGAPGLRFFEKFIPVYDDWTGARIDLRSDVYRPYDELREIDFNAFRAEAESFGKALTVLNTQTADMGKAFDAVKNSWQGQAADAAGQYVAGFLGAGRTITTEFQGLAGTIQPTVDAVSQQVREFAKTVHGMYSEQCAGKTPDQARDQIRIARGHLNAGDLPSASIDSICSGAWSIIKDRFIGMVLGGPVGGIIGTFVGIDDMAKKMRQSVVDAAKKWLDTAFRPEFEQRLEQFHQACGTTQAGVQQSWQVMLAKAKISDDPFKGMRDGQRVPGAGQGKGRGGGGSGTGGGGGGGAVPPTPPTGGTGHPGTGAAPPEVPQPPVAPPPTTPQHHETVTIKDGDSSISVDSPDGKGHVKIKVDLGDGKPPKSFDVDFGAGTSPLGGGTDHSAHIPGGGVPHPPDAPGGAPGHPGGPDHGESDVVLRPKPGEDKVVLNESNPTITAQRDPGSPNTMKITVDHGDGSPPKTYSAEFDQNAGDHGGGAGGGHRPPSGGDVPRPPEGGGLSPIMPMSGHGTPGTPGAEGGVVPGQGGQATPAAAAPAQPGYPPQPGYHEEPGYQPQQGHVPAQGDAPGPQQANEPAQFPGQASPAPHSPLPAADMPAATSAQSAGFVWPSGQDADGRYFGGTPAGPPSSTSPEVPGAPGSSTSDSPWGQPGPSSPDSPWGQPGAAGPGLPSTSAPHVSGESGPVLASLPDHTADHGQQPGGAGAPGGMMGAPIQPGGAGGMGGGGGDHERGSSPWRIQSQLFDSEASDTAKRLRDLQGEDPPR